MRIGKKIGIAAKFVNNNLQPNTMIAFCWDGCWVIKTPKKNERFKYQIIIREATLQEVDAADK